MTEADIDARIRAACDQIRDEEILPLLIALSTLVQALAEDPSRAKLLALTFRLQAQNCRPVGQLYLEALAKAAEGEPPDPPLRDRLRVLPGGLANTPRSPDRAKDD